MIIKVCGVTTPSDAQAAVELGATAVGLNFYPKSPRFLTVKQAIPVRNAIGRSAIVVGVFVGGTAEDLRRIAEQVELDVIQVHGEFSGSAVDLRPFQVWRALPVDRNFSAEALVGFDHYLLDTPTPDHGGSGKPFDWSLVRELEKSIVIAGGLDGTNVRAAIQATGAIGADACSRLEIAPGRKDHVKMKEFIDAARARLRSCSMISQPDRQGHFGPYGGRYVPEVLMAPLEELEQAYLEARLDPAFQDRLKDLLTNFAGRPTPLYFAERLTETLGGARIYFKREDLLHTGAHKINNALGQGLLAKRMGKKRIIAETGAGQHGVATATACARLGLQCVVYMGSEDMRRQRLNVFRMRLLGAEVIGVDNGSRTLKDAISEAMRDWVTNVNETFYILGSALGAHPYPMMVRDFHRCMGEEARRQILERERRLPDRIFACVGGGSNAIGIFHPFLEDEGVRLIGVEAGGRKIELGQHAARFEGGAPGVLHGAYSYVLQDGDGQVALTHSVSAGLDYPSVGPEHAFLFDLKRTEYVSCSDERALQAAQFLAKTEGLIPALETAHAIAEAIDRAPEAKDELFLINLSGRGDKDTDIYRANIPELDPFPESK